MKKPLSILAGFLLIFMLAACNQTAEPVNNSQEEDKETEEVKEEKSELTLEEVFEKTTAASEELKSFSVVMDMTQEMSSDQEEALNMTIQSNIEMDAVTDPMAFHQKMKMAMAEGEEFETESYFSQDGMFMHDPSSGQWMKFPQDMTDVFLQMADQQQSNPADQLKQLEKFVDDFTFEQDDNQFILKLKASGDKFSDFLKETAVQSLPPELAQDEVLNNMNITSIDYEIYIDKKTFYPSALNMNMEMAMTIEEQTINMKQQMKGEYKGYNEIDAITVPQEVLDSAVEMQM